MNGKLKSHDRIILIVIIAVFIFVAVFTSVQIVTGKLSQSDEVGALRIEGIRKELQDTLSQSETSLEKIATGAEMLISNNASMDRIDQYIREQKQEQILKSDGVNFNAYIAGKGWEIIPDFDMPADYHATERLWYVGAAENSGRVYVTEPYIDSMTGQMCYTMSKLLEDGETVVAMDFTLSEVQNSITKMMAGNDYQSLIVTKEGMIVGYTDMSLVGTKASNTLPQYNYMINQVLSSTKHDRFTVSINNEKYTVFSSETNNGWYMIILINDNILYGDTYYEIAGIILIYIVLMSLTAYVYVKSVERRNDAEESLQVRSKFIASLSEELQEPLKNIMTLSNSERINSSTDMKEDLTSIRESGLILSQKLDNMISYAHIASEEQKLITDRRIKQRDMSKTIRKTRAFIIIFFVVTMLLNILTSTVMGYVSGYNTLCIEMDEYYVKYNSWINEQNNVLSMFTNVIEADPEILDDYDWCVEWMNSVASNYPDISVCYIANPYKDHTVVMNNGWQPDEGWKVEDRQWYKDTIKSESGYSISAPYIDNQTNSYCITLSRVVYGKNQEFLGVFGIDFFMDKLISIFGENATGGEYAFLADASGNMLNHPNADYDISSDDPVNIADTPYRNLVSGMASPGFRDYNGKLSTGLMMKDPTSGFTIYLISEWWGIYGFYVTYTIISVAILIACIIVVLIMINRIIHWQNDVNEELTESVRKADAAGKAKSRFLAQMSHEIRTPINAVIGMDEMILRSTDDPVIKEYANNINSAGKTLLELVNGILDFSKIEEGRMEIIPVKYEFLELARDLYNLVADKAEAKGLELIFDIDPDIPLILFGDDVRLKQVILNLLTNAVKYTHQGSVTLAVSGVALNEETYQLHVSVKDTGIGIKEADMNDLFKSFRRLDETRNRNIEGTGLGISIVQGLLKMMDSELKVESIYGTGSEFFFNVDQKIIDNTPAGEFVSEHHSAAAAAKRTSIRIVDSDILVVDDNDMNLKVATGLLKIYGVTPDLATGGEESIRKVSVKRYDLIFMDHMMPGMDGIEALKELVKEELVYDTPVICLTANAVTGMRDMYLKEGFDDYLSKPIEVKELENILVKYLPKDKVVIEETDDIAAPSVVQAQTADSGNDPMEMLREAGFDTSAGVDFSAGSEEFYIEMLNAFEKGYEAKSEEIQKDFMNDDWENYRIHVHALKGTAKMIGATRLAEAALAQEMAAKEARTSDIIEGYMPLIKLYEEAVHAIRKALPEA